MRPIIQLISRSLLLCRVLFFHNNGFQIRLAPHPFPPVTHSSPGEPLPLKLLARLLSYLDILINESRDTIYSHQCPLRVSNVRLMWTIICFPISKSTEWNPPLQDRDRPGRVHLVNVQEYIVIGGSINLHLIKIIIKWIKWNTFQRGMRRMLLCVGRYDHHQCFAKKPVRK